MHPGDAKNTSLGESSWVETKICVACVRYPTVEVPINRLIVREADPHFDAASDLIEAPSSFQSISK